jgi:predicted NUDIX family NTP pyrophosphohydrolase
MAFPEIDRADFFDLATAKRKIKAGQEGLIEEHLQLADHR